MEPFNIMDVVNILTEYPSLLPLMSFALLILAGLGFPISEDIVMIVSGAMAATLTLKYTVVIAIACFCGAYFGDVASHCIGKFFLGKAIIKEDNHRFIKKLIPIEKLNKAEKYFAAHGKKTLFFGRFIPFGARNILFITSGLLKMRLKTFMIIDSIALLTCMSITFSLGYIFSSNFRILFSYVDKYKVFILYVVIGIISFILLKKLIKTYLISRKNISKKMS